MRTRMSKRTTAAVAAVVCAGILVLGLGVWRSGLLAKTGPATPVADAGLPSGGAGASSGAAAASSSAAASRSATPPSRPASPKASTKAIPQASLPAGLKTVKVMVLGDSISAGAQDEVMDGYRLDLLKKLPGYSIDYVGTYRRGDSKLADQDMQAEGGACIRANPCNSTILYDYTAAWISATKPNIVIMQGGGNDYCCGHQDQPDSVVIQAMTDWINLVWKTKPDIFIVVIGMTDYHDGYKNWIPKYVAQLAAAGKHIGYVSFDGIDTYDTVHPNIAGYDELAGRLVPVVRPILDKLSAS